MKIKSLTLNHYKKFSNRDKDFHFNFEDTANNKINEISLITANNGGGKTSLLQAIAVLVGSAVRDKFNIASLEWPGYNYRYIQNGRQPVKIEAELEFEQSEVDSTIKYCTELKELRGDSKLVIPPNQTSVTLYLNADRKVQASAKSGVNSFFLTKGHQYAKQLEKEDSLSLGDRFEKVGGIYWYDEQRTSESITKYLFNDLSFKSSISQIDAIKNLINRWYSTHLGLKMQNLKLRHGQFDKFERLKKLYESVFIGRTLEYVTLSKGGGNGLDVIFNDGKFDYDISEMSAGERAIFPLLLDFANLKINNSIILIDEIELHLHPPLQQQFLDSLPKLGNNNQFIITSHSPFIASQFSDRNKIVINHD